MSKVEQILLNRVKLIEDDSWSLIGIPNSLIKELEALISDQVAKARIEETSLWYNEWGNGTDEIGDGSWEDYYAHRIQTLNGVKNK